MAHERRRRQLIPGYGRPGGGVKLLVQASHCRSIALCRRARHDSAPVGHPRWGTNPRWEEDVIMLFGKSPAKMTVEEQLEYLVRKLGSRFMAPMFRAGFTHFNIAAVLARAAGECCPSKGHLEDLHRVMNAGFDQMRDHLAEELVEGAEKQLAEEAKESK
jgi:hypothetical protein